MKKIVLGILVGVIALNFTACEDKKVVSIKEKIYTIEDFTKNKDLREKYLKKCKNGEIHPDNLNCINVNRANYKMSLNNTTPVDDLSNYIVKTPKKEK
ncbi:MAG: EexN family lipoprotein [Arcobacter sp.]|nr:EexN family lipoprotein [Arcobacter sp.]